ncbi:hypothetical protein PU560_10865 [Georgenia sp. 10Sc9-8]|uniref:Tryptophan-rich sensory protein n=1 Tax=Georgenia halotolerans TaxID=3028317 RepID=A0ABT5TY12_9MICO|nr:hypothetical protein [Georgenia halotolerans]
MVYTGLGAYTVWQWTDRDDPRSLGWLVTATLLLNAAWIRVIQAGWVGGGRLGAGAALVWGLIWTAVARTTGDLQSTPVAVAARIAAAVVLLATLAFRVRAVRAASA